MESFYKYTRYTLRFVFFIISNLYSIPAYLVWMTLLLPLRVFASSMYRSSGIEEKLTRMLESAVVIWLHSGGYGIIESGEDINLIAEDEAVVLINHQSTADAPILLVGMFDKGKGLATGKAMWVLLKLFKYTNFGVVALHRQDFFIDQGKDVRKLQLDLLKDHLKTSYLHNQRKWIGIFPEGGFLRKRLEASQQYARKNNYPILNYCTLPRLGAIQTIVDTVGEPYEEAATSNHDDGSSKDDNNDMMISDSHRKDPLKPLKWVIDLTLAYKGGEPLDMLGMCIGYNPRNDILLHWRAYRVKEIPREEADLTAWVYERYAEKDEILRAYYQEGTIPGASEKAQLPAMTTRYLRFDNVELALIQIFFIVSSYLHYMYFWSPLFGMFGYLFSFIF